ncbi:MAG: hypothetical protein ACK56K_07075 [Akkermansiaceae bacterium]|jgi:hypothetical protein
MDSIFGDNFTKLEKPYSIKDLAAIDRLPDGAKRCQTLPNLQRSQKPRGITHDQQQRQVLAELCL